MQRDRRSQRAAAGATEKFQGRFGFYDCAFRSVPRFRATPTASGAGSRGNQAPVLKNSSEQRMPGAFTMALSLIFGQAQLTAERMDTTAEVSLDKLGTCYVIRHDPHC
jgi:hypothetical protein